MNLRDTFTILIIVAGLAIAAYGVYTAFSPGASQPTFAQQAGAAMRGGVISALGFIIAIAGWVMRR